MARRKIIAGNWKMNMTPSQAVELVNTLKPLGKFSKNYMTKVIFTKVPTKVCTVHLVNLSSQKVSW